MFTLMFGIGYSQEVWAKRGKPTRAVESPDRLSASESSEIKEKLRRIDNAVEKLQAEMDVLREQNRMVIQRTQLGFLDQFYSRMGISLISPRSRTFEFRADTGLGAFAGIGHYLGRNHAIELDFNWDIYPSLTLCYRFEFHNSSPPITWGPVIGYKTKAFDARPFDDFLDEPESVKNSFFVFGAIIGFPVGRSLLSLELLYLTRQQAFFTTNVGFHFFF